jgi:hypothetical protein
VYKPVLRWWYLFDSGPRRWPRRVKKKVLRVYAEEVCRYYAEAGARLGFAVKAEAVYSAAAEARIVKPVYAKGEAAVPVLALWGVKKDIKVRAEAAVPVSASWGTKTDVKVKAGAVAPVSPAFGLIYDTKVPAAEYVPVGVNADFVLNPSWIPKFEMDVSPQRAYSTPGGTAEYEVYVRNVSGERGSYAVWFEYMESRVYYAEGSLGPGESATLTARFKAPDDVNVYVYKVVLFNTSTNRTDDEEVVELVVAESQ